MTNAKFDIPIEKAKMLMLRAFESATYNSTCARRRVGAIIYNPDRDKILGVGYNRTVSKTGTCEQKFWLQFLKQRQEELSSAMSQSCRNLVQDMEAYIKVVEKDCALSHRLENRSEFFAKLFHKDFFEWCKSDEFRNGEHWQYQDTELHSEIAAILDALEEGHPTEAIHNSVLFSSRSPCIDCAKAILAVGIKKVYYTELSEKGMSGGLKLLQDNIELEHIEVEHNYYT